MARIAQPSAANRRIAPRVSWSNIGSMRSFRVSVFAPDSGDVIHSVSSPDSLVWVGFQAFFDLLLNDN